MLDDFDLTPAYEEVIEECLEAGVQIDAIGPPRPTCIKGYRGEEQIAEVLERFSRFGLPLQMTETTLVSGDLMPSPHRRSQRLRGRLLALDTRGRGAPGR